MAVFARKLKEMVPDAKVLSSKKAEEVAEQMIDRVLKDVLGVASLNDLDGLPIVLRKTAYDKLKEQAYQLLKPLLLPLIERENSQKALAKDSGSTFFGDLSKALAKDIFKKLPVVVSSYRALGIEFFTLVSKNAPTDIQADEFATEIAKLAKLNSQKVVTTDDLALAYASIAKTTVTPEIIGKLNERKAINAILNVLITPEEITEALGNVLPSADKKLLQSLAGEMHHLTHNSPEAYQHFSGFGEAYIEGILLQVFLRIAKINPPKQGEDSFVILTKKLLVEATKKIQEAKKGAPSQGNRSGA